MSNWARARNEHDQYHNHYCFTPTQREAVSFRDISVSRFTHTVHMLTDDGSVQRKAEYIKVYRDTEPFQCSDTKNLTTLLFKSLRFCGRDNEVPATVITRHIRRRHGVVCQHVRSHHTLCYRVPHHLTACSASNILRREKNDADVSVETFTSGQIMSGRHASHPLR